MKTLPLADKEKCIVITNGGQLVRKVFLYKDLVPNMTNLSPENMQDLRRAFDLTQDSGVVDQYGAKKMLQIFNMNPTTEDVNARYVKFKKDPSSGLTFEEFEEMFRDYLATHKQVPVALTETVGDLFDGPVTKTELRKILTEMGSEPFEPDEADEVINEIAFDDSDLIAQEDLCEFLLNRVNMQRKQKKGEDIDEDQVGGETPDNTEQEADNDQY